jgi:transglutaminase/protease-like cytokinesis protein 3
MVAAEGPSQAGAAPRVSRFTAGDPAVFAGIDFTEADARAMGVPLEKTQSMGALVRYLTEDLSTDVEKFRSLFVWIADNIAYDGEALRTGDVRSMSVEEIFLTRKGVCQHYAELLSYFSVMAGLNCKTIGGRAIGYPKSILLDDTLHAWNVVRLRGAWYLADATWSAGWLDDDFLFHKAPKHDRYFLDDPAKFVKSHLPDDPVWQLLDDHWTLSEFLDYAAKTK